MKTPFIKIIGALLVLGFMLQLRSAGCADCHLNCNCVDKNNNPKLSQRLNYNRYYEGIKGCRPKNCPDNIWKHDICFKNWTEATNCFRHQETANPDALKCLETIHNKCSTFCHENGLDPAQEVPQFDDC